MLEPTVSVNYHRGNSIGSHTLKYESQLRILQSNSSGASISWPKIIRMRFVVIVCSNSTFESPPCVWYMCAGVIGALYLSHLHFSVFAALHLSSGAMYSSSNCHRSDFSSLVSMDGVIGHPRHRDQCDRYNRDFRHLGPRQQAQPGPKGKWEGVGVEAPQLVIAARRQGNWCRGGYRQLAVQHASALSILLIDTFPSFPSPSHLSPCLINGPSFDSFLMLPHNTCQRFIYGPIYRRNPTTVALYHQQPNPLNPCNSVLLSF